MRLCLQISSATILYDSADNLLTPPALVTAPAINGTFTVGGSATITPGVWSGNPTPTITRQWQRFETIWVDITDEEALSYSIGALDESKNIRCVEYAVNSQGDDIGFSNEEFVNPAVTEAVSLAALTAQVKPSGTGTRYYNISSLASGTGPLEFYIVPKVIEVTLVDNEDGTYRVVVRTAGEPLPALTYEYLLNDVPVDGQTASTIDAQTLELSGDLKVTVTATNDEGEHSLTSAATAVDYGGGGGSVVSPVLLSAVDTYRAASTSHVLNHGAYSVGDLVVIDFSHDSGPNVGGISTITAPNAETINVSQTRFGIAGTGGVALEQRWFIATAAQAADDLISVTLSSSDQVATVVSVYDAGTFNPSSPLANFTTNSGSAATSAVAPATTATNAGGKVHRAWAADAVNLTDTPAGHTLGDDASGGAVNIRTADRDTVTTASESVATASSTMSGAEDFVALTCVVNPYTGA